MAYIMAPAFSPAFSPVPSPAPPPPRFDSVLPPNEVDFLRRLGIAFGVLVAVTLLYLLFFLGRIRRSVRWKYYIAYTTKISYVVLPFFITYIIGVLHDTKNIKVHDCKNFGALYNNKNSKNPYYPPQLYPVMAATLVYAYGGVVTISACDLRDNDETLQYVFRMFPLFLWTAWLTLLVFDNIKYKSMVALVCTMVCLLGLAMINARQTLEACSKASKSKGLPSEVEPVAQHMNDVSKTGVLGDADPKSMRGFKYMVWGTVNNVTTLDEIWKWVIVDGEEGDEGERRFLAKCGGKDRLRDMCLSYALFRMLLVKFAGFAPPILDHTNPIHPRRLIQEGILVSKEAPQRVFQIIEVELNFLFDYFYTKSHVCASYRFRDIWKILAQNLLIGAVALIAVPIIWEESVGSYYSDQLEANVTSLVLLMVVFLESINYLMVHFSSRKLVWLLCMGIRETSSSSKWASITQKRIVWIWSIKSWLSSKFDVPLLCFFWPWQRKLGQYSFLDSYYRVPILARKPFSPLAKLVKLPRRGQRGDHVVPLSNQVKEAIISSLLSNRGRNPEGYPELNLSRGSNTIGWYQLPSGCGSETSEVSFILVWHIATSFCESLHPRESLNDSDHEHFLVANQLSKYCAYLAAFTPQLLPHHQTFTLEREFDKAVREALELGLPRLKVNKLYEEFLKRPSGVNEDTVVVVERGFLLAKKLLSILESKGWKILAEFWAELLLYLASSHDMVEHVEYLARGGEFITHLWVLLTHAGAVPTNSSSSDI